MANSVWEGRRLGVIGAGNMAEAIVRGATGAGVIPAERITVYDPLPERRELFVSLGCRSDSAGEAAGAGSVLLAVKPQQLPRAAGEIRDALRPGSLCLTIVAGATAASLAALLAPGVKIVRIMPNTPLLVGFGVSALARGPLAGEEEMRLALALFSAAGDALELAETELDAVTALSGGGPAYLFRFAEALAAGGERLGLAPEVARRLTVGTLRGASEMLARGGEAGELRERVTSRGGTTAEALKTLENGRFPELLAEALAAARDRSRELGREVLAGETGSERTRGEGLGQPCECRQDCVKK
ncbi:MAG: pyrroline-5-carboxylate reductase [Planctomycetota bacterium]|jgi:pyrroline-5-carboxylate reductase|nr:pyrroline-5-carboxylate reductase [Planctomycetota bacterium]